MYIFEYSFTHLSELISDYTHALNQPAKRNPNLNYKTLLKSITPSSKTLALIVFLLLVGSLLSLANPWMAGLLTKSLLAPASNNVPQFQIILAIWFVIIACKALLGFATSYLVSSTATQMDADLRTRIYDHLQALPLTYHQDRRPGDLLTLLSSDSQVISDFVTNTVAQLLPVSLTFIGALVIMAWLDPLVAGLALLLMPVYFLAMKIIGRKIRPLAAEWIQSWSNLVSLTQENLALIPAIKAFLREPVETRRFDEMNQQVLHLTRRQILIHSALTPAIGFLAGTGLLLLLWVGANHVQAGVLETSELVSLLLYAMLLTQPISRMADVYGKVMRTRGAAERLLNFFGEQAEPQSPGKSSIGKLDGAVEFRDVTFAYPGRKAILERFNLSISAGETVALVGPNGTGKTTLAHLLMRFMNPASGQIFLDGKNIEDFEIASVRQQIGLVAQHTLLLNGTVAANIIYGHPQATPEQIKKAAKAARADEFIESLPDGYNTIIGDQGIKLSGGQRQRLSLARTLMRDPAILILDEATSMFDPESERLFIDECHDLLHHRTVILITHRPASLNLADRIIQMKPHHAENPATLDSDDSQDPAELSASRN